MPISLLATYTQISPYFSNFPLTVDFPEHLDLPNEAILPSPQHFDARRVKITNRKLVKNLDRKLHKHHKLWPRLNSDRFYLIGL
jgi:hypothetical protein